MTIWIDAQLSPALAAWLIGRFGIVASHVKELGLVEASDPDIFNAARAAAVIVLTKDRDFVDLVKRRGPPPQIVWITAGNTSNRQLTEILGTTFPKALELLIAGEAVVEIKG